jgi:hypothetical protein
MPSNHHGPLGCLFAWLGWALSTTECHMRLYWLCKHSDEQRLWGQTITHVTRPHHSCSGFSYVKMMMVTAHTLMKLSWELGAATCKVPRIGPAHRGLSSVGSYPLSSTISTIAIIVCSQARCSWVLKSWEPCSPDKLLHKKLIFPTASRCFTFPVSDLLKKLIYKPSYRARV